MNDHNGFHLPSKVVKSWKTLEQCCCHISSVLYTTFRWDRPKVIVMHIPPPKPSEFSYFNAHPSEEIARSAISKSLDAFVILFAFVSFCIAIDRAGEDPGPVSSLTPEKWLRWLQVLSERTSKVHPEWVQLVVDSPIADFTTSQCLGAIVNVFSCTWHHLVSYMLRANVPIWLYWGILPGFSLHPNHGALHFAPHSHPKSFSCITPISSITPVSVHQFSCLFWT